MYTGYSRRYRSQRARLVAITRDLQLLIAAIAVIAGVAGALILPNFWLRMIVLVAGLLAAAYITGLLQQVIAGI